MIINKIESIQEAYIGKTKLLLEMEKTIDAIRNENKELVGGFNPNIANFPHYSAKIESSKNWQKLRSLLEDQFGFYSVNLYLWRNALPNALTFPVNMLLDDNLLSRLALADGQLIKYEKSWKICTIVAITPALLFSSKVTSAEILAMLLHEIGHNFNSAILPLFMPLHTLAVLKNLYILYNSIKDSNGNVNIYIIILAILNYTGKGRLALNTLRNMIQKIPGLNFIVSSITFVLQIEEYVESILTKMLYPFAKGLHLYGLSKTAMSAPELLWTKFIHANVNVYHQEHFADSFASIYGYGPDLSSCLTKLDKVSYEGVEFQQVLTEIPIIGHISGLIDFTFDHIVSLLDGHPNLNARIKTSLVLLEKDLDDPGIDKKTKEMIKKDIKRTKEVYAAFNQINVKSKDSDPTDYSLAMRSALERILEKIYGPNAEDFRSKLMDWVYGGASSIKNSIDKIQKNKSWF